MDRLRPVYVTGTGAVLPGPPVGSEAMEAYLGRIGGEPSRLGPRVLRWNGIRTRHYALTPEGDPTHTNAGMSAEAVRKAADAAGASLARLEHLATATTQGDLLAPGHGAQVHAELGCGPLELASFQSVCGSAIMAAKSAWQAVRTGEAEAASACAGEHASRWFRPHFYEGTALIDAKGRLALEAEYLRWTLSDGAGAIWLAPEPSRTGVSLRVDWIDIVSLADRFDPCMWAGGTLAERHDLSRAWPFLGPEAAFKAGAIALQQDFDLLKIVIRAWIGVYLQKVDAGRIRPEAVDHLLLHYSARSLREEIVRLLTDTGAMIDEARWFNNLATAGNTGSASIWIMLDAFLRERAPKPGETVLGVVPESGRGLVGFMHMTAVGLKGDTP
ncbi:MAG: 3-oxoacyl-[acyl-carrier-protein] synthase III C-terminal domain-containing protein [Oceanicaulis sp.]